MKSEQVQAILEAGAFPGAKTGAELRETHISWVILTPEYAFKIKKPLKLHFLDFGTLEKRRFYCGEEVRLNRRLAPDMYLGVVPVGIQNGHPEIGPEYAEPVDYAVQMRRLDSARQMDRLLPAGGIGPQDLERLAATLAAFHLGHRLPDTALYDPADDEKDFADLFDLRDTIRDLWGGHAAQALQRMEQTVPAFLRQHAVRRLERARQGFWVDGHGDLHSRNIFILPDPVVFDCIEFNPHFRRLDVLSELAFLSMDLEFHGRRDLAGVFMEAYQQHWSCLPEKEDALLFRYYKAYRANVRLKVALLEYRQDARPEPAAMARRYWELLQEYVLDL